MSLLAAELKHPGDTAEMLAARERFLGAGHYAPIAAAVAGAANTLSPPPGMVLELGAGTGHYLRAVLDALPDRAGVAIDSSVHAARRAAGIADVTSIRADAWRRLPLADDTIGIALSVFAPRNAVELARVVAPGGALIVVTPGDRHLAELIEPLGLIGIEAGKVERLRAELGGSFEETATESVEFSLSLSPEAASDLAAMGPSAHHAGTTAPAGTLTATASVRVSSFRRRGDR